MYDTEHKLITRFWAKFAWLAVREYLTLMCKLNEYAEEEMRESKQGVQRPQPVALPSYTRSHGLQPVPRKQLELHG